MSCIVGVGSDILILCKGFSICSFETSVHILLIRFSLTFTEQILQIFLHANHTMLSGYCRPSSRPPDREVVDLTNDEEEPSKQSKEVSFAWPDYANHESPRSCTNTDIFRVAPLSPETANQEANAPGNNTTDVQEETPAEVAMLLCDIAHTVSKEIEEDPPIMAELADAFPTFPNLSMDYEDEQKHPNEDGVRPALMHFDHQEKKTRAVSMDVPHELREAQEPLLFASPPSPPHEEEAVPNLLQWHNLRGETTSPPHQPGMSIFSTPPASPSISSRKHPQGQPNSEHRRSNISVVSRKNHHRNRPRSVSLAEAARDQIHIMNLKPPDLTANEKPMKLILRKKFSWKNYPEVRPFAWVRCYCSLCNALFLNLYLISFIFIFQLEEFLVANREEYLRHSTLNYTMQQKKYNNCLTERMIKLAEEHGYTFDPTEVCLSFPNEREVYILHYCT